MSQIRIVHPVTAIRQSSPNDCWAAAIAMVRGMSRGRQTTSSDVREMARQGRVRIETDGTLPTQDGVNTARLANAVGLTYHDVRSTPLDLQMTRRLLERGRLVILGMLNNPFRRQVTNHAITVYGFVGDGTGGGTTISFVDPYDGQTVSHPWDWFEQSILVDPHFVLSH
jgi:hypothetical protein